MTSTHSSSWHVENQRYLSAELQRVRAHLESRPGEVQPAATEIASSGDGFSPALERVCRAFDLSPFERDILLLCAGAELDSSFSQAIAARQGEVERTYPTFSLALAALPEAHWSALTPAAPLRRWHLIEIHPGDDPSGRLTTSQLRIDERLLHFLTGVPYLDRRLEGLVFPVPLEGDLPPSQQAIAQQIIETLTPPQEAIPVPVIFLCADRQGSQRAIAASACQALDAGLYQLSARDIPTIATDREFLARLWEREAALNGYILLLDLDNQEPGDHHAAAVFLEPLACAVIVASHEALPLSGRLSVRMDVPPPSHAERHQMWRAALGSLAGQLNGNLDALSAQFNLSTTGIRAAAAEVSMKHVQDTGSALWDASRRQARPRLNDLAQRIESAVTWNDLVLPEIQRQTLLDIAAQVRQRRLVYETWGMAARNLRNLGISALFTGPSGTGKTLAAEILANELRLDLYRIDLSSVVSKYIGETEKNLRRVFDAAEDGGAILLFDEADALFGKRSEVKDSHDRYANVEVSYLLQRMEAYRGLAILTSNMKSALDPAFLRRIRFVVSFPFPDAAQRAEIWLRMFPPQAPTEGLDWSKLAKLNLAGGNIRNIALNAAFIAADAGEPVRMNHLLRAARSEYAKLEKTLNETEISGWV
jgi:ATP-dependent 26S proteasome regulatory subunit